MVPPSSLPSIPVQAEGLRRKGEELKEDWKKKKIKCALTVFDCFCTIFLRVDLKQGWAASWISYSLLSVFIYNPTYLQITGGTSAPTLAPNLRSDVFAIYHLIFNAQIQFSFKTEELSSMGSFWWQLNNIQYPGNRLKIQGINKTLANKQAVMVNTSAKVDNIIKVRNAILS